LLPYLLAADIVNTGISASLVFAGRLVYPSYGEQPRMFGLTPLADQAAAGAFMWVIGSIVFLIPAFAITMQLLSRRNRVHRHGARGANGKPRAVELGESRPRISHP
jgi:putative membrane protein